MKKTEILSRHSERGTSEESHNDIVKKIFLIFFGFDLFFIIHLLKRLSIVHLLLALEIVRIDC